MAQNVYECMLIFDSNRYAKNPSGVGGEIDTIIKKLNGTVRASRLWNEQRLAYPINGQRKGSYWLTYFSIDSSQIDAFNRACRLNENILRHLVIKIDPRLQEAMIAHALGTSTRAEGNQSETKKSDSGKSSDAKRPVAVTEADDDNGDTEDADD